MRSFRKNFSIYRSGRELHSRIYNEKATPEGTYNVKATPEGTRAGTGFLDEQEGVQTWIIDPWHVVFLRRIGDLLKRCRLNGLMTWLAKIWEGFVIIWKGIIIISIHFVGDEALKRQKAYQEEDTQGVQAYQEEDAQEVPNSSLPQEEKDYAAAEFTKASRKIRPLWPFQYLPRSEPPEFVPCATDPKNPAKWIEVPDEVKTDEAKSKMKMLYKKVAKSCKQGSESKERVKNYFWGARVCRPWQCLVACLSSIIVPLFVGIGIMFLAWGLGKVQPTDCQCCAACEELCSESMLVALGNQVRETSISGIAAVRDADLSDTIGEGLDLTWASDVAQCWAPDTPVAMHIGKVAEFLGWYVGMKARAVEFLGSFGSSEWLEEKCDCMCDRQEPLKSRGNICQDLNCTDPLPNEPDLPPKTVCQFSGVFVTEGEHCLALDMRIVDIHPQAINVTVYAALFRQPGHGDAPVNELRSRHVVKQLAQLSTASDGGCLPLAAASFDANRLVGEASGRIMGAPVHPGCLSNTQNNCDKSCMGMQPGETYDMVAVCEITDAKGKTILGERKEMPVSLPDTRHPVFIDGTPRASAQLGQHDFTIDLSTNRPGQVHWLVLEPEAPVGAEAASQECVTGEPMKCMPFQRGLLDYQVITDRETAIRNRLPWCHTMPAQDLDCSKDAAEIGGPTCPRVPFGWQGTAGCMTWARQDVADAAEHFHQQRSGGIKAFNGTRCWKFKPVAGGISDLESKGSIRGAAAQASIKVSPDCSSDRENQHCPRDSDMGHLTRSKLLKSCTTYAVCLLASSKQSASDGLGCLENDLQEGNMAATEAAPPTCFTITTACLPPEGDIVVESGLSDFKISASVVEPMAIYWVLEDIDAGDCGSQCSGSWMDTLNGISIVGLGGLTEQYIYQCAENAAARFPGTNVDKQQVLEVAENDIQCIPGERLTENRRILMAGVLNIPDVEFDYSVFVTGLQGCRKFMVYTLPVYKAPGCNLGLLIHPAIGAQQLIHPIETLDGSVPRIEICSVTDISIMSIDGTNANTADITLGLCEVSKSNLALVALLTDADNPQHKSLSAESIVRYHGRNQTCASLDSTSAQFAVTCPLEEPGATGNIDAAPTPSELCVGQACLKDPCTSDLRIRISRDQGFLSCGKYSLQLAYQDGLRMIQPEVVKYTFVAPDTEKPEFVSSIVTEEKEWAFWQVTASESAAVFVAIRKVSPSSANANSGTQVEIPKEVVEALEGFADEWTASQSLRVASGTQGILMGGVSEQSCCRGSADGTQIPVATPSLALTQTPTPIAAMPTEAAEGLSDSNDNQQFSRRGLLQDDGSLQVQQHIDLSTVSGDVTYVALDGNNHADVNITGLEDNTTYALSYLIQDLGGQCGRHEIEGKDWFNRNFGVKTFTTGSNVCRPRIANISMGPDCAAFELQAASNNELDEATKTFHIVIGQKVNQYVPGVTALDVAGARPPDGTDNVAIFPGLASGSARYYTGQADSNNTVTILLNDLRPDTVYSAYIAVLIDGSDKCDKSPVQRQPLGNTQKVEAPAPSDDWDVEGNETGYVFNNLSTSISGRLWHALGCAMPAFRAEDLCPEDFRAHISSQRGFSAFEVLHDSSQLLTDPAELLAGRFCAQPGCSLYIDVSNSKAGAELFPGSEYTVLIAVDDGNDVSGSREWPDNYIGDSECRPEWERPKSIADDACSVLEWPNMHRAVTLRSFTVPGTLAPRLCPQDALNNSFMSVSVYETEIEISAQLNASGIVAWAVWDTEEWMATGGDGSNPTPEHITACNEDPSLNLKGYCGNVTTQCTVCSLKIPGETSPCCSTGKERMDTKIRRLTPGRNYTVCVLAAPLDDTEILTSPETVHCQIVFTQACFTEACITKHAKPTFKLQGNIGGMAMGPAVPLSRFPPISAHASYFPVNVDQASQAYLPQFGTALAAQGIYNLDVDASGMRLGSGNSIDMRPLRAARVARVILRTTTLYPDNPVFDLVYTLQDEYEHSRVDLQGLQVQATVGNGAAPFTCSGPDAESGVGECKYLEARLEAFAAQSIDVTVSALYNGGPVISKTEQMALAEAVSTPSRGTAGMWVQMPSSPRYPCQQFSVSVFANTGGEDLAEWVIQLTYDNSIVELLTNTADSVTAAVRTASGFAVSLVSPDGVTAVPAGDMQVTVLDDRSNRASGSSILLMVLEFRVRQEAEPMTHKNVLSLVVNQMNSAGSNGRSIPGTELSNAHVHDARGAEGQLQGQLQVAPNLVVGLVGHLSPTQDIFDSVALGNTQQLGDQLTTHVRNVYAFSDGTCSLSAENAFSGSDSLLGGGFSCAAKSGATTATMSRSSASQCTVSLAASDEGPRRGGIGYLIATNGNSQVDIPFRIWMPENLKVHASDTTLNYIQGSCTDASLSENQKYQRSSLYVSADIIGGTMLNQKVDVTMLVTFELSDSTIARLVPSGLGGKSSVLEGRATGALTVGVQGAAAQPVQVQITDDPVTILGLQVAVVTGVDISHSPVPTSVGGMIEGQVKLRHQLQAERDTGNVFVYVEFSDDQTQDVSTSPALEVQSVAKQCLMTALKPASGSPIWEVSVDVGAGVEPPGSLIRADWNPCSQMSVSGFGKVNCSIEFESITADLDHYCLTSAGTATAATEQIATTATMTIWVKYKGTGQPVLFSTDDRVKVTVENGAILRATKSANGPWQLTPSCSTGGGGATIVTVSIGEGVSLKQDSLSVQVTCDKAVGVTLEALPWPACDVKMNCNDGNLGSCSSPFLPIERPTLKRLFCSGSSAAPFQRAALRAYMRHSMEGGLCPAKIDITTNTQISFTASDASVLNLQTNDHGPYVATQNPVSGVIIAAMFRGASGSLTMDFKDEYVTLIDDGSMELYAELAQCPGGALPQGNRCGGTFDELACSDGTTLRGRKNEAQSEPLSLQACFGTTLSKYCIKGKLTGQCWSWIDVRQIMQFQSSQSASSPAPAVDVDSGGVLRLLGDSPAQAQITASVDVSVAGNPGASCSTRTSTVTVAGNLLPEAGHLDLGNECGVPIPKPTSNGTVIEVPVRVNTDGQRDLAAFRVEFSLPYAPTAAGIGTLAECMRQATAVLEFMDLKCSTIQNAGVNPGGSYLFELYGTRKQPSSTGLAGQAVPLGSLALTYNQGVASHSIQAEIKELWCSTSSSATSDDCRGAQANAQQIYEVPLGKRLLQIHRRELVAGSAPPADFGSLEAMESRQLLQLFPASNSIPVCSGRVASQLNSIQPHRNPTTGAFQPATCSCQLQSLKGRNILSWWEMSDLVLLNNDMLSCVHTDDAAEQTVIFYTKATNISGSHEMCVLGDFDGDCKFGLGDSDRMLSEGGQSRSVDPNRYPEYMDKIGVWGRTQAAGWRLDSTMYNDNFCGDPNNATGLCPVGWATESIKAWYPIDIRHSKNNMLARRPFLVGISLQATADAIYVEAELRDTAGFPVTSSDFIDSRTGGRFEVFVQFEVYSEQSLTSSGSILTHTDETCDVPFISGGRGERVTLLDGSPNNGTWSFASDVEFCADPEWQGGTFATNVRIQVHGGGLNTCTNEDAKDMSSVYPYSSSCSSSANFGSCTRNDVYSRPLFPYQEEDSSRTVYAPLAKYQITADQIQEKRSMCFQGNSTIEASNSLGVTEYINITAWLGASSAGRTVKYIAGADISALDLYRHFEDAKEDTAISQGCSNQHSQYDIQAFNCSDSTSIGAGQNNISIFIPMPTDTSDPPLWCIAGWCANNASVANRFLLSPGGGCDFRDQGIAPWGERSELDLAPQPQEDITVLAYIDGADIEGYLTDQASGSDCPCTTVLENTVKVTPGKSVSLSGYPQQWEVSVESDCTTSSCGALTLKLPRDSEGQNVIVVLKRTEREIGNIIEDITTNSLVLAVRLKVDQSAADFGGVENCGGVIGPSGGDICLKIPLNNNALIDLLDNCQTDDSVEIARIWWPLETVINDGESQANAARIKSLMETTREHNLYGSTTDYRVTYSLSIHLSNQDEIYKMDLIEGNCGGASGTQCDFKPEKLS